MDDAEHAASGPTPTSESPEEPADPVVVPPVVAVLVTRDPGPWLEESLGALAGSEYPALAVLVLDAGSEQDPTARVAAVLPKAFVRRLAGNVGFAAAANEALESVSGATFLLLCHDDVVLDPAAVRLLVEEAYRSNAAIVGPKLVDYDRPEVLLEVGMSIDRFAVPHSGIEPGEIDQEQHDSVRDVFYVSSAVMLVRADLFAELHGFDAETFPGGEDLDLCWRARVAGARVMVAPDARARHRQADELRDDTERISQEVLQRSRLRAMLKSYSAWSLAYLLPLALFLGVIESIAFVFTRRRDRARAIVVAWTWNLRHLHNLRIARHETQALRRVSDAELRPLQVRGSARVRSYVAGSLHAEDRIRTLSERSRTVAGSARGWMRDPAVLAVLVFVFFAVVGSRALISGGVPVVGQLAAWPGASGLLASFTSAWRSAGLGSTAPAPSELGVFSVLGFAALGATELARTFVVVGALPLGGFAAWRLGRRVTGSGWAGVAAGLAYGVNPLPRNALAAGRFGALVLFALGPFIVSGLLRIGGYFPELPARRRWRGYIGTGVLVALTTAVWPPALVLPVLVAIALLLAAPLVGDRGVRLRAVWAGALAATGVGLALLLPWPLAYLRSGDRLGALGFAFRPYLELTRVLRFETGPNGAGAPGWMLFVAALLVLVLASGPRLAWATRAWMLALVSFASVWVPARFFPSVAIPAVDGLFVPAALGISLAIGLGVAAFLEDVRRLHFGWRQVAAVTGAVALALPALGFAADALDGRWHMPARDWDEALAWMRAERSSGSFRVLWLGDASVLPLDPLGRGETSYGLTDDGPGDARTSLPPPSGGATARVGAAVDLLRGRRSNRVGRLLAPMAVRYVAVPETSGPGSKPIAPVPGRLRVALDDQLDFVRLESPPGLVLYENRAWVPGAAALTSDALPTGVADPLGTVGDAPAARPIVGDRPVPAGWVLWSETFDDAWHASANSRGLRHRRAFGWANGYELPSSGSVAFSYAKQWLRYPALLLELAVLVGAFLLWRGSARFELPWRRRRRRMRGGGE